MYNEIEDWIKSNEREFFIRIGQKRTKRLTTICYAQINKESAMVTRASSMGRFGTFVHAIADRYKGTAEGIVVDWYQIISPRINCLDAYDGIVVYGFMAGYSYHAVELLLLDGTVDIVDFSKVKKDELNGIVERYGLRLVDRKRGF